MVAALVAIPIGISYLDDEIRRQVQTRIANHYDAFDVEVQAAQLVEGEGILIRGLSLTERGADGPRSETAYFEEIFLHCRTDLKDLLSGDLGVKKVVLRRPTLHATHRSDGSWSVEKFFPFPKFSKKRAVIHLENATVEIFDPLKDPSSTYAFRNINMVIRPDTESTSTEFTQPEPSETLSRIEGSLAGDYLDGVQLRGWFDAKTKRWSVGGSVESLTVSPGLRNALPGMLSEQMQKFGDLHGQIAMEFLLDGDPSKEVPVEFDVKTTLAHGRIDDERLPYPLTAIAAKARFTNNAITLESASARSGRTVVHLQGKRQGYASNSPVHLEGNTNRLVLDRHLMAVLPPAMQASWKRMEPAGEIDAQWQLDFDGQTWHPQMLVQCRDVSFSHHKFPYRLERGTGEIRLDGKNVTTDMTAYGGDRPVRLLGKFTNPGPQVVGQMDISVRQLPVDKKLIDALPEKSRKMIRSLHSQGAIDARIRLERRRPDVRWQRHSLIQFANMTFQYEKFPYPLRQARGVMEEVNRKWEFRDLVATGGSGWVTGYGHFIPLEEGPGGNKELELNFRGAELPLNMTLRNALKPKLRDVWDRFKPNGLIRFTSQIRFHTQNRKLDLKISAEPSGESVEIYPVFFPYRMEKLQGVVSYQDGLIQFPKLTAQHGRTQISTGGESHFRPDGSWDFTLSNLTVDRLQADRELLDALPGGLRRAITKMNFAGPLALTGKLGFARGGRGLSPVSANWDIRLTTQRASMTAGVELENVNGNVYLIGSYDGRKFHSQGWLDLDSIIYQGFQFTELRGPISIKRDQILLGSKADIPPQGQQPRHLTARFGGGVIASDCEVNLGETDHFLLQANLAQGDLQRLMDEARPGNTQLKGNLSAFVQLHGTSAGRNSLRGFGEAHIRDGDIGELPLLVSLLKILSGRSPNQNAFNTGDVNFRIRGDHVYFDKINFKGDAVSLMGQGEMSFDKQIRMMFYAVVGRDELKLPVINTILKEASQQLLTIYVDGTLENPRTTREPLPGVKVVVEGIQKELEPTDAERSFHRQASDWMRSLVPSKN